MTKSSKISLRSHLILWFVGFSVFPLFFMMGVSISAYKEGIAKELYKRLVGNVRELSIILEDFEAVLSSKSRERSRDNSLVYYMSQDQWNQARSLASMWLSSSLSDRLSLYNREGRMEVALYKDDAGKIQRNAKYESTDFYLTEDFLKTVENGGFKKTLHVKDKGYIDLIAFSPIATTTNRAVGYIEEIIRLDDGFLEGLKNRLNIEVAIVADKGAKVVASHDDLENYPPQFFYKRYQDQKDNLFDLNIREEPFGFVIRPLQWGDAEILVAVGASKQAVNAVLRDVRFAFVSFVVVALIFLGLFSVLISRYLVRPVTDLVEAIQSADLTSGAEPVSVRSHTSSELSILSSSFNDLFARVYNAQNELKKKIEQLELANQEIRETQAKLVHTAKMASLGQLVAGIAHELNNPIGFIYSNMEHLRDYSQKLIGLVRAAEEKNIDLSKEKAKVEFDYLVQDLPKLITSCEDGARRTRDIVVGLRNFSRLEEAVIKEVDLREGLDNTLSLLRGETKNRIEIVKNYEDVPLVRCYASQMNQVFMNILSNAVHAIEGEGTITVTVKKSVHPEHVEIYICDSGKGMDEDTQNKIFDPFFTTKSVGSGTGLGLSISYGIVQKHEGEISVMSTPGEGTEFKILLPVRGPKT